MNKELKAEHIFVETLEDLQNKLSGSKYVQSKIGSSYKQVKTFLQQNRKVLFSGTPCQIAGLKNYLRKDYENLTTVDLVCHGVPSPMIFEDYKKYLEKTYDIKLTDIKFRDKKFSWIYFNLNIKGQANNSNSQRQYIGHYYKDPYLRGFLRDYYLRPSCHQCPFTSINRCSDFTIADWWGYQKKSFHDKNFGYKGVSLILANTTKALALMNQLNMILKERTIEETLKTNISLSKPFNKPQIRVLFWKDYFSMEFDKIIENIYVSRKSKMVCKSYAALQKYRQPLYIYPNNNVTQANYKQNF